MRMKCLTCKKEYIVMEWTDCKVCENCGESSFVIDPKDPDEDGVKTLSEFGISLEVIKERRRQDEKWGEQNHGPFKWLAILGEEVGEANKAALEDDSAGYRNELIQVAAVAMAMVGCHDRQIKKAKEVSDECEECMKRKDFMYYDCQLCKER